MVVAVPELSVVPDPTAPAVASGAAARSTPEYSWTWTVAEARITLANVAVTVLAPAATFRA